MTSYDALVIADGAQAYWKMDEPAGSGTLADSTANGLNLTIVNPNGVDGYQVPGIPIQGLASAIDGGGSNSGVSMYATSTSASFQLTPGQSFSFEVWVGGVGNPTSNRGMFTRGYQGVAQDSRPWYLLQLPTDGTVVWWLRSAAGVDYKAQSFVKIDDASYASRGPWHHLVGTFDAVAGKASLYIDGQLQTAIAAPNTGWGTNAGPFALGCFNGVCFGEWACCAAFYLAALSPATILNHYETGRNGVIWYPYQQTTDYGNIISTLSALSTLMNRLVPPIISTMSLKHSDAVTGSGSLALSTRVIAVVKDFVPAEWGYLLGTYNVFENRLTQVIFAAPFAGALAEAYLLQYDQHEDVRFYMFNDNLPATLYYDVAPGAGVIIKQYDV